MSTEKINSVHIKNFKSVVDLSLDLGAFNVLIGENGCGKSNILEALAFGAAANANKLDYEFLGSRGIRVTNPEFMYSAFREIEPSNVITLSYRIDGSKSSHPHYELSNDPVNPKRWQDKSNETLDSIMLDLVGDLPDGSKKGELFQRLMDIDDSDERVRSVLERRKEDLMNLVKSPTLLLDSEATVKYIIVRSLFVSLTIPAIANYIIYAPEQSSLRRFEESNQMYPLGIKGEGLFQYLKDLSGDGKNAPLFDEIRENLSLIDWFENFALPEGALSNEFSLNIKDKYLSDHLQYFDQRSTNEGFLYLLFYFTLFLSEDTPAFFAIDNIDTSLNPKLCMQLTRTLARLAVEKGKQVIVTTQNPAVLDGLNLKDDNQRLFVVRRNDEGHTRAERIEFKPERKMKLSEVWTSGYIGGLPENF